MPVIRQSQTGTHVGIILGSTGRVDSLILIFVDSLVPHSCLVMVCNVSGFFPF